jgi:nickel-dependent lactate racemase
MSMGLSVADRIRTTLPKMVPVKQKFKTPEPIDVTQAVKSELSKPEIKAKIKPQARIAIGVGSRGIANLSTTVFTLVQELLALGARPFIIPAMGSHGGGTAEGQEKILEDFGITEKTMGVPIISSMDVEQIGKLVDETPVYIDKAAFGADAIIIINRIKPHTSFKGDFESGLLKMMAIGLGKHKGALAVHQRPMEEMPKALPELAQIYLAKTSILFGLALLENAYDQTSEIIAIPAKDMLEKEKQFLVQAKENMPRINLSKLDVLVVSEMGKNISGTGMDPNITGRASSKAPQKFNAPPLERIVVLGLTKETKGNANGIGIADITTRKVFNEINLEYVYQNSFTSKTLESAKIPVLMENDYLAICAAINTCYNADQDFPRIVWIKNTLELDHIWVSEACIDEIVDSQYCEVKGNPMELEFDQEGFIASDLWSEQLFEGTPQR